MILNANKSSIPSGGTTGQALVKASDEDGDVKWGDVVPPVNLLLIEFLETAFGRDYTVKAGTEVYSGTVLPETIKTICAVKQPNTEYTVTLGTSSTKVTTGPGFGPMVYVDMKFVNCLVKVTISGFTATSVAGSAWYGDIQFNPSGRNKFSGIASRPGPISLIVTKSDGTATIYGPYEILDTDEIKNITVSS